jgi:hypothetical protein|nr:MAG TPA: hypothetical protein [Caudoviricetes sp.]
MITIQCTLFSVTNKYRPISTLLEIESIKYYNTHKQEVQQRAIDKIVVQRKTERWCLKRDGYTRMKVRVYDKKKIEEEEKRRYEKIKKERGWS